MQIRPRPAILGGNDPRSKGLPDARVADDAAAAFLREVAWDRMQRLLDRHPLPEPRIRPGRVVT